MDIIRLVVALDVISKLFSSKSAFTFPSTNLLHKKNKRRKKQKNKTEMPLNPISLLPHFKDPMQANPPFFFPLSSLSPPFLSFFLRFFFFFLWGEEGGGGCLVGLWVLLWVPLYKGVNL